MPSSSDGDLYTLMYSGNVPNSVVCLTQPNVVGSGSGITAFSLSSSEQLVADMAAIMKRSQYFDIFFIIISI